MTRRLGLWGPVAAWAALIFALSARPDSPAGPPSELPELMFRKLAHVVEYAVLGVLVSRALAGSGVPPARGFRLGLAFCVLYAVSDEIHQSFVPGRYAKARDVALDGLGAALALSVYFRWQRGSCEKPYPLPVVQHRAAAGDPQHHL